MSAPAPGVWEFDAIGTLAHRDRAPSPGGAADIAQLIDGFDRGGRSSAPTRW
ncbi:MAG: hypothetical protein R2692_03665 [Microbacterium sp.]